MAVVGLSLISEFLDEQQLWLRLVGGLIMFGVGVRLALVAPPDKMQTLTLATLTGAFTSTLATPSLIPYMAGLLLTFGVPVGRGPWEALPCLALGVFIGAAMLRFGQTLLLGAARGRLAPRVLVGRAWWQPCFC